MQSPISSSTCACRADSNHRWQVPHMFLHRLSVLQSLVPMVSAGKSECSKCKSANGRFCRACLKIRYGMEMEEVREQMKEGKWLCPHCYEEENPKAVGNVLSLQAAFSRLAASDYGGLAKRASSLRCLADGKLLMICVRQTDSTLVSLVIHEVGVLELEALWHSRANSESVTSSGAVYSMSQDTPRNPRPRFDICGCRAGYATHPYV